MPLASVVSLGVAADKWTAVYYGDAGKCSWIAVYYADTSDWMGEMVTPDKLI